MGRVLQFAVLPPDEGDGGDALYPTSDHRDITSIAVDQALDLMRRPEEAEEDIQAIVLVGQQYIDIMAQAIGGRTLKKANIFLAALPNSWLRRPDYWLVTRCADAAVVNAL